MCPYESAAMHVRNAYMCIYMCMCLYSHSHTLGSLQLNESSMDVCLKTSCSMSPSIYYHNTRENSVFHF